VEVYRDTEGLWRWTRYAPNGAKVGASTQGYSMLRDLSHNLEQNLAGYRLLDQDGALEGPDWFMYGLEATCPDAYRCLPEDLMLGMGMVGVRIPVSVPDGVNLSSRR
jgi:hypothetical protein